MKPSLTLAVLCLCAAFAFYIHRATNKREDSGALFIALALCLVALGWAVAVALLTVQVE
jgi:hypothetical protein